MRNVNYLRMWVGAFLLSAFAFLGTAQAELPVSLQAQPRDQEGWWTKRMEEKNALAQQGGWNIVFVGDSITHGLDGSEVWKKYYEPRKALNLGFSGDRTEHVLWRLDNGNLNGFQPKAFVVMIGTNNAGHHQAAPADTALGVVAIVEKIRTRFPEAKILVLGIFCRGANNDDPLRKLNDATNEMLATIYGTGSQQVKFLNINDKFLSEDGTLSKEIMPDLLHPNAAGQEIWAQAIEADVKAMLGE
ncbi:MAG: GDSL-type esterase/lipase family protein [Thermoguttaceae bacterium]|nr:GDSL-type esterase/lipase family protein [Thermoguttaceae bacterium]